MPKRLSDEHRQKISQNMKEQYEQGKRSRYWGIHATSQPYVFSEEHKQNISKGLKKAHATGKRSKNGAFQPEHTPWNKGKKGVMVAWNKGLSKSTDSRVVRYAQSLEGNTIIQEAIQAGKWQPWSTGLTKETDSKIAAMANKLQGRGHPHTPETKEYLSKLSSDKWKDPEHRRKHRESSKRAWDSQSEEEKSEHIKKALTSKKPNYRELQLDSILQDNFPNEWKYVGNGQIKIGSRYPDFIDINERKAVIEFFGERWHDLFDEARKAEEYKFYGFKCLVIWGNELADPKKVVKKIRRFRRACNTHKEMNHGTYSQIPT